MTQPPAFSLRGAVDLGARQAAAQRRQQAARAGSPNGPDGQGASAAGNVIEVTDQTFNTEVAERSRSVPVIMDLWAEWCGPCKQLGPVLEKLADEAAGAWVLAKVDVDANPRLSEALAVQSIPMVVAVVAGQIVDGFLGALPEAQVREWIGRVMQAAAQLGVTGAGGPGAAGPDGAPGQGTAGGTEQGQAPRAGGPGPAGATDPYGDPAFGEAQAAMERGDLDGAAAAFQKVLDSMPGHPLATMGLAQVGLIRRVSAYDQAAVLREAEANPDDPQAQARAADIDLATDRIEEAFERLLGVVRRTSGDDRNAARVHLLSLFEAFPPNDPRVSKARARLSSLLF
jgi:putative thioredoxin